MKKLSAVIATGALAILGMAMVAQAIVTFDPATGTGFVGKGDVQLVYGWNDAQLQNNAASVQFSANSTVVSEVSWECTNSNNDSVQERARTTTTSVQGLVTKISREILKNKKEGKVNGFILDGYTGTPTESSTTEGPAVNSCPNSQGTWSLTTPAGDPVVDEEASSSSLQVSTNGTDWFNL